MSEKNQAQGKSKKSMTKKARLAKKKAEAAAAKPETEK
jgi:hypothetical protein